MDYVEDIDNEADEEIIEEIFEELPDGYELVICNEKIGVFSKLKHRQIKLYSQEYMTVVSYINPSGVFNKNMLFFVADLDNSKILTRNAGMVTMIENGMYMIRYDLRGNACLSLLYTKDGKRVEGDYSRILHPSGKVSDDIYVVVSKERYSGGLAKRKEKYHIMHDENDISEFYMEDFDDVKKFAESGYAKVQKNTAQNGDEYNIIDGDGHPISDLWFDFMYENFDSSYMLVMAETEFNDDGTIVHDGNQSQDGFLSRIKNSFFKKTSRDGAATSRRANLIRKSDLSIVSKVWYDEIKEALNYQRDGINKALGTEFNNMFDVKIGKLHNIMLGNGELLLNGMYEEIKSMNDELIRIKLNGHYNIIGKERKVISSIWYKDILNWSNSDGLLRVENDEGMYNIMSRDGKLLSKTWFKSMYDSANKENNYYKVVNKENKYNFLRSDGKLVLDKWYNALYCYIGKYAIAKNDYDKYNIIDRNGNIVLDKWYGNIHLVPGEDSVIVDGNKKIYLR